MELTLFRALCLASSLICFFVLLPLDHQHNLTLRTSLAEIAFGIATLFLFRESRRGRHHITALLFLILLILNLIWFDCGGSQGSVDYYFFVTFIYPFIFFRGKQRLIFFGIALANCLGLIALEQYFPQWIVPFHSAEDRIADLMTTLTVSSSICALMLWVVLSRYDREQMGLTILNAELEQSIAQRAQVEKSLNENREILHAVVEGTSDAVYAKDMHGRYILFNRAAADMTGKSAQQTLGKDDTLIFPPDLARNVIANDREILSHGKVLSYEFPIINAAGEQMVWEAVKGPLRDEQGETVGVFGVTRDVTAHRRALEEIQRLNDELEFRVAERTASLEAAMQEQEAFSYSVSHDLRAPLRHINSYSAILEEEFGEALPGEARDYLERIRRSSRTMGSLIDDLLELGRIGRSNLRKTPVNLSELAGSIAEELQVAEPGRRVEFVIEPGLRMQGDQILLRLMLENLLGNAWKYSSGREISRIEVGRELAEAREVFFVKDNGVGFDMAYHAKLFGAFQRLHGPEFEGAGIGLATVKRIVERHGGSVWAKGALDEGATIYFVLP